MPRQKTTEELFGKPEKKQKTTEELFGNPRVPFTSAESALMGGAQGVTLGYGDEIYGGVKSLYDIATTDKEIGDLGDVYRGNRDYARGKMRQAAADSPTAFTGGELAGGTLSAFVPGLQVARGAGLLGKAGILAKGAIGGGIAGLGQSEADLTKGEFSEAARDIREGAAIGAGAGAALHGAGKAVRAIDPKKVGKISANVLFNTPEELTELYLKDPQALKSAPRAYELVPEFEGLKEKLKKKVIKGSAEARKQLEGVSFQGKDLAKDVRKMAGTAEKEMGGKWNPRTRMYEGTRENVQPGKASAVKWLRSIQSDYKSANRPITGSSLKDDIQAMGEKNYKRKAGPGQFEDIDPRIRKHLQGLLNYRLKKSSPAYKKDMVKVKEMTTDLARVNEIGTEKGLPAIFKKTQSDEYGKGQIYKKIIENMDKELGTNFMEKVKLSYAREAFDKSITNGSMNVQKFRGMVEGIPFLRPVAGFIGAAVDKYGRKMTMQALDVAIRVDDLMKSGDAQQIKEVIEPLIAKAREGNYSAVIALGILEQSKPGNEGE